MDSTGKTTEPPELPPQPASAAQISAVLGNDDILREILLRLDFPTCLVRAAAVSKRWLRHASDPAFLRRFRRLHPPRLLGFYLDTSNSWLRFLPLPQPPELAAVIRRGNFDLGRGAGNVSDCHNGRLIVYIMPDDRPGQTTVCRPLHPGRGATVLPLPQIPSVGHDSVDIHSHEFLFHGDGGDDMAISAATVMRDLWQARVQLQDFQAGAKPESRT
jgi:hypothetical protein